ncbi:MAG: carboxypeptidase-like regulatory domain-containing protein, partial [Myxococcota bacterium]
MSDHPQTGPDLRLWGGVLIATVVLALGVWFMRHEPLPAVSGGVQDATDKAQPNPSATSKAGKGSATTPTLKGAVLDVESRAGIPDAEVICSHGGTTQTVRADASGRFVVDLPPDGRIWAVTATAPGFALEGDPFTVRAEPGATVQVLLAQRGTIAGAVFHLGKPMEGAEVRLLKLSGVGGGDPEVDASVVRTDRAGQFVVEAFPGRVRVLATSEGFATAESREIQVCGGARVEGIVLDLTPRGSVVALVRSEEGTPVSQARVEVMGVATWQVPSPLTDTEGRAELKDVPAGESRLRVTALGYSIVETTPLTIVPDETLEHTIVLPALQGISGRVVDPNGQPVRGASVVLKPASEPTSSNRVHTGHAGQFRFDGLDVGAYLLSATHPRYGPATEIRSESGGQEPVVLTLSEGGAISGHVLDASRQPAPAFTVVVERFVPDTVRDALEPVKLGPAHFGAQPFDSAEGVFQLDGLGPGVYDLYVDGGDLGSGQAEGIVVQAGRTTSRVTVELEGGSVVTGQVVDAQSGAPIADAEVALADGHRRR